MSMQLEETSRFSKELETFWLRRDMLKTELLFSAWHVTMYRIQGQGGLVRVDFRRRVGNNEASLRDAGQAEEGT